MNLNFIFGFLFFCEIVDRCLIRIQLNTSYEEMTNNTSDMIAIITIKIKSLIAEASLDSIHDGI